MQAVDTQTRMLGESTAFLEVLEHISQLAPLNKPVLIIGERGTGKELVAERLHFLSERWGNAFIKMNCAAVNEELLESELFGHEAGAFTGASKKHTGRFERADGGSLFLDELSSTSLRVQEKLLRIVEYGEFERLGGDHMIKTDTRIIAATNMDLPALTRSGRFRHDLLDRLSFAVITLPPLRHRDNDVILLAEHFAINMCRELNRPYFPGFSESARTALLSHNWPGNIRELKNVIERAVYRNDDAAEPIHSIVLDPFESPYRPANEPPHENQASRTKSEVNGIDIELPVNLKQAVKEYEIRLLNAALDRSQYKQTNAARLLGLSYHQLRAYLRKYGLP